MELLRFAITLVLCALSQAFTLSTVATVSLALFTLNKPVLCVFGVLRRRRSPIQEAVVLEPEFPFYNQPMASGFNPFTSGGGASWLSGVGTATFGQFGASRFPARFPQTRPIRTAHPKREAPSEMLPVTSSQAIPVHEQMSEVPYDAAYERSHDIFALSAENIESYFAFLAAIDEKKCTARVICEMGANPGSGGDMAQRLVDMIGSLNGFPQNSKVAEYHEALTLGMVEGLSACDSTFPMCDEESYENVRFNAGLTKPVFAVPREQSFTDSTL